MKKHVNTKYDKQKQMYIGEEPPTFAEYTLIDKIKFILTRCIFAIFCIVAMYYFWLDILFVGTLTLIAIVLIAWIDLATHVTWYRVDGSKGYSDSMFVTYDSEEDTDEDSEEDTEDITATNKKDI